MTSTPLSRRSWVLSGPREVGWGYGKRVEQDHLDPPRRSPKRADLPTGCRKRSKNSSIVFTERLEEIGAAPSIGTIGIRSIMNAMAEITIGLFKTELHRNSAALAATVAYGVVPATSRSPSAAGSDGPTTSNSKESSTISAPPSSKPATVGDVIDTEHSNVGRPDEKIAFASSVHFHRGSERVGIENR